MNVEVTKLPESKVALKVELAANEVEQALDRTYKQLVQRIAIPGFRKGKAPREVLERVVGPEYFLHEATQEAVRWGYRKAIEQEALTPIDEAEIAMDENDHVHLHEGESFHFEASVTVQPDVQLPDYHALRVERPEIVVSDEDVQALLHDLQERTATVEPVERPADTGDVITMNVTGRVGPEELINEDNADFLLRDETVQDADPNLPGLSKQMVGSKPGDIREIALQMPADHPNPELADKQLELRILVKEVKQRVLPPLDDDFARSVSEFETLENVREAVRTNLTIERTAEAEDKVVAEVMEAVTSRTFIDIPQVLVEEELDREIDDMRSMLERQQLSFDTYLNVTQKSEADLRTEMREQAVQNVKQSLVLDAVSQAEGIEVTRRQIDVALEELFRAWNTTPTERRRLRSSSGVRQNISSRLQRQLATRQLTKVVTGAEEASVEPEEALADQTAEPGEDMEETVAVEVGG